MTTIDRITTILNAAGYKQLAQPFKVSALPFEFAAAFVGHEKALDLILVVDLFVEKNESRLVQKIQSLARALDLAGSRRSLTIILVGTGLDPAATEAISRVCRVLPLGVPPDEEAAEQYIRDWLAVLLPLPVLDSVSVLADWRAELKHQLGATSIPYINAVVDAAQHGAETVEATLSSRIQKEVSKALGERSR